MGKYFPKLGDVVWYGGKRMIIVHIRSNCIVYPVYFYHFLEENLVEQFSFTKTDELIQNTICTMWVPNNSEEEPPFTKIDTEPYKTQKIDYTKIEK